MHNEETEQQSAIRPATSMTPRLAILFAAILFLITACSDPGATATPIPTLVPTIEPTATARPRPTATATPADPGTLAQPYDHSALSAAVPALAEREARFAEALASDQPILLLENGLDEKQRQAQDLAVADADLQFFASDPVSSQPLRSEIMGIRPALPTDLTQTTVACEQRDCYRVEMFNYPVNATAVAIVDIGAEAVLDVTVHADVQPEIPAHLADLAAQIAVHSPEVVEALGFEPGADQATMPNVKTALNGSQCERTRHLCVAPTFLLNDEGRALWSIVDLTDGRLVGTRWTELGNGDAQPITEQGLQDAVVMARYCEQSLALSRDGWDLDYTLTSSDGLAISDVRFDGEPVLRSAKLVDWHVSYSGQDGFGYSDATGCPLFSTASVVAFNGPAVEEIVEDGQVVGFALVQDFRSELWPLPCNYRYVQRYEFYADGRLRVGGANLGRGCGNNGTYRPVIRMDLTAAEPRKLAEWDGETWQTWTEEGWTLQDEGTPFTSEGFQFRIDNEEGQGLYLEPNRGQFGDGSHGDNAFTFVSAHEPAEGDADMITIGSCCNEDFQQGPEKFLEPPQSLAGQNLVLWYVPQMENEDTPGQQYCWAETAIVGGMPVTQVFPCAFGPMFVPISE